MGEEFSGVWAVVFSSGKAFIGCIKSGSVNGVSTPVNIKETALRAEVVQLLPAFDFFSPIRPMQNQHGQIAYARDPVVTTFDFTVEPCPVWVKASGFAFFNEMSEKDVALYKGLVRDAMKAQTAERAKRSGIVTP